MKLPTTPTIDGYTVARLLDIEYGALMRSVRNGTCFVTPLKVGRSYRWPTQKVLDALGIENPAAS